jgi:hypothetical protein
MVKAADLLVALAIVILGINAWATMQLLKEFRQFRRRPTAVREGKDGQTINVNLGAAAPVAPQAGPPALQALAEAVPVEPEEPEPEPEPQPAPRHTVIVTSSGAVAIKCPKCGAENSAYRSECFMCESPLK